MDICHNHDMERCWNNRVHDAYVIVSGVIWVCAHYYRAAHLFRIVFLQQILVAIQLKPTLDAAAIVQTVQSGEHLAKSIRVIR